MAPVLTTSTGDAACQPQRSFRPLPCKTMKHVFFLILAYVFIPEVASAQSAPRIDTFSPSGEAGCSYVYWRANGSPSRVVQAEPNIQYVINLQELATQQTGRYGERTVTIVLYDADRRRIDYRILRNGIGGQVRHTVYRTTTLFASVGADRPSRPSSDGTPSPSLKHGAEMHLCFTTELPSPIL